MEDLTVSTIKEISILSNQTPRSWHQKECIQTAEGVAVVCGKVKRVVIARWYMGRSRNASVVYCALSASTDTLSTHGHGQAGGGGYCKILAALDEAIRSANIELSRAIHGTGEHRKAIEAIVRYLYPDASDIQVLGV